jgi:hypothetical protein
LYGVDSWNLYSERFGLVVEEGLLTESERMFSLSPRGMFFADSIAGFLAESRWRSRGNQKHSASYNDNRRGFM